MPRNGSFFTVYIFTAVLVCISFPQTAKAVPAETETREILGYVTYDGQVPYDMLADRQDLFRTYYSEISSMSREDFESWTPREQLAFLINLYNVATLDLVSRNYPVESIKEIGGIFRTPWQIDFIPLFGREVSLDEIEHKMIRKNYSEPRIHFALVCAAKGCPPLRNTPYSAGSLEDELEGQARRFLSQPLKNRIEPDLKEVYLSPIFKWYGSDFGKNQKRVLNYVKSFFPGAESVKNFSDFTVRYSEYDWSLNEKEE